MVLRQKDRRSIISSTGKDVLCNKVASCFSLCKDVPKYLQKTLIRMFSKLYLLLKKDPDRVILSADKGNCVVVMDKHDYREKALSLLNNRNTYSILKSDPTGKTQRGLNAMLLLLKKSNIISKATYEKLYSSDGNSIETYCVLCEFSYIWSFKFFGENFVPCGGEYRKHCQKLLSFCRICKR